MTTRRVRGSAIFASIWTTIQGAIILASSTFGVMVYQCKLDFGKENILTYVFNLIYFHNEECTGTINLGGLDDTIDIFKNITLTKTPLSASRTYTWMTVYLIMSCLWIAASLLLFFGAVFDVVRMALHFTVIPWVLVTAATLVADVVALSIYSSDINETNTFRKLLDFLDVNIPYGGGLVDVAEIINKKEVPFTWIPSALMMVYFSRCILFWMINMFLLVFIITGAVRRNRWARAQQLNEKLPPSGPLMDHRQYFQGRVLQDFYPGRRSGSASQGRAPDFHPDYRPDAATQGRAPDFYPESRDGPASQERLQSVDRLNSAYDTSASTVSDIYSYPLDTVTENWLARHNGDDNQDQSSSLKRVFDESQPTPGPEELRGQLPWSYFQDRRSRPAPRRQAAGERPPVPVPDYTLRFPKRLGEDDKGQKPKSSPHSVHPGQEYSPPGPAR